MSWIPEGDKVRCLRHNEVFARPGCCAGCATDPGDAPDDEEPEKPDPQAIADERWCRDLRDELVALARRVTGKSRISVSNQIKAYEAAIKAHRAAVEERHGRDEKDHDRWLVKRKRELERLGAPH